MFLQYEYNVPTIKCSYNIVFSQHTLYIKSALKIMFCCYMKSCVIYALIAHACTRTNEITSFIMNCCSYLAAGENA